MWGSMVITDGSANKNNNNNNNNNATITTTTTANDVPQMAMLGKVHIIVAQVTGGRVLNEVKFFTPGGDEKTIYSQLKKQGIKRILNSDLRSEFRLMMPNLGIRSEILVCLRKTPAQVRMDSALL
jgi:hypothetical protein